MRFLIAVNVLLLLSGGFLARLCYTIRNIPHPIFRTYILFEIAACAHALLFTFCYRAYYYTYWPMSYARRALLLAVIYELASKVFAKEDKPLWVFSGIGLVAGVTVVAYTMYVTVHNSPVTTATHLLVCGVYLIVSICASSFGLHRSHPVLGISLGLAVLSGLGLIQSAATPFLPKFSLYLIQPCTYLLAVVTWNHGLTKQPMKKRVASVKQLQQARCKVFAVS
jgi:hypothetical protein